MSVRTLNWLKFGGLVALAFALGLLFAGLLDLPNRSSAQESAAARRPAITPVQAPAIPAAKSLTDLSDAFAAVAEQVRPSVVYIKSQRTERTRRLPPGMEQFFPRMPHRPDVERGSGSGFIVSPDGYILTNNHVVEGAEKVTVRLLDRREFKATVVGTDPATDVAVLKVDVKGLTPSALGDSDAERIGEWVLAIGNPLGDQFTFTVTSGIISAKGRGQLGLPNRTNLSIQDFIQTDAAINPGNSGGPLVNVRGEVIGINSAIASETGFYSGYGFAIPINLARVVMNQIITTGHVSRAALGIFVEDADANDAAYVGLDEIRGVRVRDFPDSVGSPAKKAGLEPGDVIITIDGKPVNYTAQLQQVVGFRKPGDIVKVEVARKGGVRKTFNVRLMEQKEEVRTAQRPDGNDTPNPENAVTMDRLGIAVQPVTPQVARELVQEYEQFDENTRGLLVTEVQPDGPAYEVLYSAEQGGPGPDIIQAVEGKPVRTESDLRNALKQPGPGGVVTLRVYNAPSGQTRIERLKLSEAR